MGAIQRAVADRFTLDSTNGHENRSAFKNNDIYQFKGCETTRSLGAIAQSGIIVSVDLEVIPILEQAAEQSKHDQVPIT